MTPDIRSGRPAVTVVIPTYNFALLLKTALDSVITQTFPDWEAVVVNNHSNDNTIEVVESFRDPRIRLVNFSNNGVIAASRNAGVRQARASSIAFLDSDDFWYPRKLEVSLGTLASGYDVVCHNERYVYGDAPSRKLTMGKNANAHFRNLLLIRNTLSPSAVTIRKAAFEAAGGFSEDPEINTAEDYELWLKLARMGASIKLIPEEILGGYRIHGGNSSGALSRHRDAARRVVTTHFQSIPSRTPLDKLLFERRLARIDGGAAYRCIKTREFKLAYEYIKSVLRQGPAALRIIFSMLLTEQRRAARK